MTDILDRCYQLALDADRQGMANIRDVLQDAALEIKWQKKDKAYYVRKLDELEMIVSKYTIGNGSEEDFVKAVDKYMEYTQ